MLKKKLCIENNLLYCIYLILNVIIIKTVIELWILYEHQTLRNPYLK